MATSPTQSLFCLFDSILVPILAEWTGIKDLAVFDSAFCSHYLRPHVLNLFNKDNFIHNTEALHSRREYFAWLNGRSLKIRNLNLKKCEDKCLSLDVTKLLSRINKIRSISTSSAVNVINIIDNWCSDIESIKFSSFLTFDQLKYIFEKVPNLKSIEAYELKDITEENVESLGNHFATLESAKLTDGKLHEGIAFENIYKNCTNLTKFYCNNLTQLSDEFIIALVQKRIF